MVFKKEADVESIASELYDFERIGAVSITDFLDEDFRLALLEQLKTGPFVKAEPFYNSTVQDFSRFSSEKLPLEQLPSSLSLIKELANAHQSLYYALSEPALFNSASTLEYSAHYYPQESAGLGSHLDESKYRNLIAVYVLSGERNFIVGKQRDLANGTSIENPPGSIILMRAPRDNFEKTFRPYHARLGPNNECYTVSFRHTK